MESKEEIERGKKESLRLQYAFRRVVQMPEGKIHVIVKKTRDRKNLGIEERENAVLIRWYYPSYIGIFETNLTYNKIYNDFIMEYL